MSKHIRCAALGILIALVLFGAILLSASRDETALIRWATQQERIY